MKTALVLGAAGGMGYSLTEALLNKGFHVIAASRSLENLEKLRRIPGMLPDIIACDAMDRAQVKKAVSQADLIFHSINIPYQEWGSLSIIMTNILEECRIQNKPFIYTDNIYAYGRQASPVNESAVKNPHTKKGKIRLELLEQIRKSGTRYIITHFPDLYGPDTSNTLLDYTFRQAMAKNKAGFLGKTDLEREFIFIKDAAEALAELALHEEAYGEDWNIPGSGTITGKEIEAVLARYFGRPIKLWPISRWMIQSIGLFDPFMREYAEMMYLNETPVILDGSKYERLIAPIPRTPYSEGITAALRQLESQPAAR
ncbi:SDR family NAD(P)-dependent oxidoreductase [Bacillus sp. MMSF_3328]|uniref:SDR family NAD(P)-dependent oxidoreductase n=1 Tax=Bacillus sp. MMSF_3328 TaxID=3047080 RepID=UPI00273FE0C6|nr:SDR family NAD(P)-dependent oxidoreductase [Bacillus sp. MMSF_3328]